MFDDVHNGEYNTQKESAYKGYSQNLCQEYHNLHLEPCQTSVSGLGSVGEGDVVLYDGFVRREGEVAEVEG